MASKGRIRLFAGAGLLFTAMIWGFAFVVVKESLDVVPECYMLAFRFTIASVALGLIFIKRMGRLNRSTLLHGIVLGAFLFGAYAFQTFGCRWTTAGKNAFLTTIYVMLVPFFHWLLDKRRPDKSCFFAAALALVGIGLLSLNGDFSVNAGDVLTLVCGFFYAVHMVFIDRYTQKEDPILLTVIQLGCAAVLSWGTAPFLHGPIPSDVFRSDIVVGMLYLGFLSTMLAFLLQNVCQKYTPPETASLLLSTESVFGVLFACLFLQEGLTVRMSIGFILMFLAILMVETKFDFLKKWRGEKTRSKMETAD